MSPGFRFAVPAACVLVAIVPDATAVAPASLRATFLGNESVSTDELESVVGTGGGISSWVLGPLDYDPANLAADAARVRAHYRTVGYLDARVTAVPPAAFVIVEGKRYGYGSVGIASAVSDVSQGRLLSSVPLLLGEPFDAAEVDRAAETLSEAIASEGNPYADVEPQVTKDPGSASADVTFVVRDGPKAFVERVEVDDGAGVGERKVLGALRTEEGDPFNATRAKGDERRLMEMEGLARASVVPVPGSAPDSVVVKVTVEPQK